MPCPLPLALGSPWSRLGRNGGQDIGDALRGGEVFGATRLQEETDVLEHGLQGG